jgi:hypothetical protein
MYRDRKNWSFTIIIFLKENREREREREKIHLMPSKYHSFGI